MFRPKGKKMEFTMVHATRYDTLDAETGVYTPQMPDEFYKSLMEDIARAVVNMPPINLSPNPKESSAQVSAGK